MENKGTDITVGGIHITLTNRQEAEPKIINGRAYGSITLKYPQEHTEKIAFIIQCILSSDNTYERKKLLYSPASIGKGECILHFAPFEESSINPVPYVPTKYITLSDFVDKLQALEKQLPDSDALEAAMQQARDTTTQNGRWVVFHSRESQNTLSIR